MKSPCCKVDLVFRSPKYTRRAGVRVCRLLCPKCGGNWLADDKEYSHPYQTRKRISEDMRRVRIGGRLEKWRLDKILENYETIQAWLDNAAVDVVR